MTSQVSLPSMAGFFMRGRMAGVRKLTLTLITIAVVMYAVAFGRHGVRAVFLFMPFTMTPFAVMAYLAWRWRSFASQMTLVLTILSYTAWVAYVYVNGVIIHPDPQSNIAFLFVGVYAAPVLIVLLLIGYSFDWRHQPK